MLEQDISLTTATVEAVIEPIDGPSQEWYDAHRTTPEQQASAKWATERNDEIMANLALKQALGLEYGAYSKQLEALSSEERADLVDKTPEEVAAHLDERAEAEREQRRQVEALKNQDQDAHLEAVETPHLREVRKAMKTAYKEVASLDERIAELQRLNELRDDPSAEGWSDLPEEYWRAAREGKMESFDSDIANLIQEKQAKLQEATLHQNAYHEEARSTRPSSAPSQPIGQIVGNDGRPMEITRADISALVQLERDDQAHQQRALEASKHYPDWEQAARSAVAAGVDVTPQQVVFIKTLPNSADVTYYLMKNHAETRAIANMSPGEAMRALIAISHKAARTNAPQAPRTTGAPKPPSPVSGSSSGDWNVNDESGSADDWMRRRNADLRKKGRL